MSHVIFGERVADFIPNFDLVIGQGCATGHKGTGIHLSGVAISIGAYANGFSFGRQPVLIDMLNLYPFIQGRKRDCQRRFGLPIAGEESIRGKPNIRESFGEVV